MVELLYALSPEGQLVHVDSVPNGLACGCRCPGCGALLVAKNNGETMAAHFAHASGTVCSGAHESELHLLAKDVIASEKAVMLPPYGSVYGGGLMRFDAVEVEERNDLSSLQPDLCGIAGGHRLWIEIRVTHAIGPEKRELIRKNGIACVEINLADFIDKQVTRQQLQQYLLQEKGMREWTNNPVLEQKRRDAASLRQSYAAKASERQMELRIGESSVEELQKEVNREISSYMQANTDTCVVPSQSCYKCLHHSTRRALLAEAKRLRLPAWTSELLSSNLLYWTRDEVSATVCYDRCWQVRYEHFVKLLPTTSPDIHGREVTAREMRQNEAVVSFLLNTVPAIIATEGLRCQHNVGSFSRIGGKYDIACNMPNVVNRHRRKKH